MGGVGGHMAHLSEDLNLTFNEIIKILGKVANAEIKNVTEKVDGQNLFLTVDSMGNIRTARNNGDIKKGGMTTEEYISKWRGHPAENAFTNGFKAITSALKSLDDQTLQELFSGGQRYVNMEIMYPKNPNIIHYTSPHVVLHGLKFFGDTGGLDKSSLEAQEAAAKEAFNKLVELVDSATATVGEENWNVHGPKVVELKKIADGSALEKVTSEIEKFAEPVGMKATLKDLTKVYMRKYAGKQGIPIGMIDDLLLLALEPDRAKERGITVNSLKKGLPKELKSVVSEMATKTNSRKFISAILQPIERAISDFAIEVLRGVKSFFVDEHDEEINRMRDELSKSISYLQALADSGDQKMGELIDKQLGKLGEIENLASSLEGIVFEYPPGSDKIYKLTGAFAMANQIIGRARRSGMNENFLLNISNDVKISKTLGEWIQGTKDNAYQKLSESIYHDIAQGKPIVELFDHDMAENAIYSTIVDRIRSLSEEDEEFEPEEIEKQTIAIVPGAFKPPHKGHADMVNQYAEMADKVIVLISKPTKKARTLPNGREVTATDSKRIWEEVFGPDLPENVEVQISTMASPLSAAFEAIGKNGNFNPETDIVILGASDKEDSKGYPDWHRWKAAERYAKEGLEVRYGDDWAVGCTKRACGTPFSASTMRDDLLQKLIDDPGDKRAYEALTTFFPADRIDVLFSILDLEPPRIEELSGMGSSSVAGAMGGINVDDDDNAEDILLREQKSENITVDEIMRLIMERGILQ